MKKIAIQNNSATDDTVAILNAMFHHVTSTRYIIHCGKTNSGKTYNALLALKQTSCGAYLAPLRLLAWEIYDKLNAEGHPCDLVTGEEQIKIPDAKFTASTIEMMDYDREFDIVVIDEAFMIGDKDRGKSWTKAILDVRAKEVHIITSPEAIELIRNILTLTNRTFEVRSYEMLQRISFSNNPVTFSKKVAKGGVFVTFSRIGVLIAKMKFQALGINAGVLYGNLPPEVKKRQIQSFIDGEVDIIIATDVIGMGLNLPCNYIVFLEVEKYDGVSRRQLRPFEVRQIAGRAGRYGMSDAGSFISASNGHSLNFIRSRYYSSDEIDKAYIGLDYNTFSAFPESMTIMERVFAFRDTDFIPKKLKKILLKEPIAKYISIAPRIDRQAFSLRDKWILLNAPIKSNNEWYFSSLVDGYARNGIIRAPLMDASREIKELEDKISEMELYLNLSRSLPHDPETRDAIKSSKDTYIEILSQMLLDKKLLLKKRCKLCSTMLDLTHPFPYCDPCYEDKVITGMHW